MVLTEKQQYQESGYELPYHWMLDPATKTGRLYYGYWNAAIGRLPQGAKSGRIADAGCGDGRVLGLLRDAGFKNLTGIDYSERALSFVKDILPDAHLVKADLSKIPLPDKSVEAIICVETLEHILPEQLPAVCTELSRLLVPGGTLVVTVPSVGMGPPKGAHYQHFSAEVLTRYLSKDFKVDSIVGQDRIGFHPLKVLYYLIDNAWWDLRMMRRWYNLRVWPRYFNICDPRKGRRLIAVCVKQN